MQKKPRTKRLLYDPKQEYHVIERHEQGKKLLAFLPGDASSSTPAKKKASSEVSDPELAKDTRLPSWKGRIAVPREAYPKQWRNLRSAPERRGQNAPWQKQTSTPLVQAADEEQRKELPHMCQGEGGGEMPADVFRNSGSDSSFNSEPNRNLRMQPSQAASGSIEVNQQLLLANLSIPSRTSMVSTWFKEFVGSLPVISNSAGKSHAALQDKICAQGSEFDPSSGTRQTRSVTCQKEKMSLLRGPIHSPRDSDLNLLAEKNFAESGMISAARQTRSAIHENKGKELTDVQLLADQAINLPTGLNLLKKYDKEYIAGTVVGYDVAKQLFKISYENGDEDEISPEAMTHVVNANTTAERSELRSPSEAQKKFLASTQKRKSSTGTASTKSPPTKRGKMLSAGTSAQTIKPVNTEAKAGKKVD